MSKKNSISDLIDMVGQQLRGVDADKAARWLNEGRTMAKDWMDAGKGKTVDFAKDTRHNVSDFVRTNDQVQAVRKGAVVAGRKAKENPLLTAAAVAAVAAAAYQINKKMSEKKAESEKGFFDGNSERE